MDSRVVKVVAISDGFVNWYVGSNPVVAYLF